MSTVTYILCIGLDSSDRANVEVCQGTYDFIVSSPWGKRYEPYFGIGVKDGRIYLAKKYLDTDEPDEVEGWFDLSASDFNYWFQRKVKAWSQKSGFGRANPEVVKNIVNTIDEFRYQYNFDRLPTRASIAPLPSLQEEPESEEQPGEQPEAPTADPQVVPVNEVHIVFDPLKQKLRAKGNDGQHGELWTRFPTNLRIEGAKYQVGSLEYCTGKYGGSYYTPHGFIRRIDQVSESLTEEKASTHPTFKERITETYNHFVESSKRTPTASEILEDLMDNCEEYSHLLESSEDSKRRWHTAVARELNKQRLETTLEEDYQYEDSDPRTDYEVEFEFTYPGETESEDFCFYVPEKAVIEAVRRWFSDNEVEIDGTDTHIWNLCETLSDVFDDTNNPFNGLMEKAVESQADWIREACKEAAWEEFVEDWQERNESEEEED